MISESMGKILGMVMAYGVSSLGLLLAYVNYRKRIVKAERVMSGTAWVVVAAVLVSIALGVVVVRNLAATQPAAKPAEEFAEAVVTGDLSVVEPADPATLLPEAPPPRVRRAWSWVGLLVPAAIFFIATWLTAALHRRFSQTVHHEPPPG